MHSRQGCWWLGAAAPVLFLAACGADTAATTSTASTSTASTSTASEGSGYCADLAALIRVLDDGGTIGEYHELLTSVVDASPAEHAATWSRLLTLSEEAFSYDNFNPAIDSLERLDPGLAATCPDLGEMIVDDAGRVRSYPTD
jgi:hypothetical protein